MNECTFYLCNQSGQKPHYPNLFSFLFYEQLFQFNLFPIKDAYHARVRVQAASLFRALCSSAYAALGRTRINRSQLPVAERTPRALHGTSRQPGTANRSHTATRVW